MAWSRKSSPRCRRIRWLFVIARNSSFTYKGRAVDIKQVGRELGVRYVLEGSVRKGGNRVRITAQLIDAITGTHVWADRYDRDLSDIFAVQDEITASVAGAHRTRAGRGRAAARAAQAAEKPRCLGGLPARPLALQQIRAGGEPNRSRLFPPGDRARPELCPRPLWICAGAPMGHLALLRAPLLGGSGHPTRRGAHRRLARRQGCDGARRAWRT